MSQQRFRPIELMTDDRFYEDAETGLLMAISCKLPDGEREAELARRSEALVERLAVKIAAIVGRPSTVGPDQVYVDELQQLQSTVGKREAKRRVAERIESDCNIQSRAAHDRLNRALKDRGIAR